MLQQILKLLILAAVVPGTVFSAQNGMVSNEQCRKNLKRSGIIPAFGDNTTMGNLDVVYQGNKSMGCGRELATTQVQNKPTVTIDLTSKCCMATIFMFDADGPLSHEYLIWAVVNICTKVLKTGFNGNSGRTLTDYQGPLQVTGNERYPICIYCQEKKIKRKAAFSRFGFLPKKVASNYSLGNPIACNYMKVEVLPGVQPKLPRMPHVSQMVDKTRKNL